MGTRLLRMISKSATLILGCVKVVHTPKDQMTILVGNVNMMRKEHQLSNGLACGEFY